MNLDKEFEKVKVKLFMLNNGLGVFLIVFLYQLKFKWMDEDNEELGGFKTAATDMRYLYWFKKFFEDLGDTNQRLYVLAHELLHVYLQHPLRGRNKGHRNIWAYAVDIEVNNILDDIGLSRPTSFPPVFEPQYKGKVAEQIYDDLVKNATSFKQIVSNGGDVTPALICSGTDEEIDNLKQQMEVVSVNALKSCESIAGGKGIGLLPMGMQSMLTPLLENNVDWKKYILRWCNKYSGRFRSWRRNSRMPIRGVLLPAALPKPSLGNMVFIWDVSGSMSDKAIQETIGQSQLIFRKFNPSKLTVITFDSQIQQIFQVKKASDLNQVEVTGRGGTVLSVAMEKAIEYNPAAIVIFSDMYVDTPQNPNVPVLFVSINNPYSNMPFGTTVHLHLE